jgi:hypothetical protein
MRYSGQRSIHLRDVFDSRLVTIIHDPEMTDDTVAFLLVLHAAFYVTHLVLLYKPTRFFCGFLCFLLHFLVLNGGFPQGSTLILRKLAYVSVFSGCLKTRFSHYGINPVLQAFTNL